MERQTKIIDAGDWTMTVHTERAAPGAGWQLAILEIRSGARRWPDWRDEQARHATPEQAVDAARAWAAQTLPD
ncbi:hypothetical protein FHW83_003289 [Duganella sp. SG902]|uniref:hypothetical protein n=1 Tax=Duganella sp. SG902 TaxID=2587016 RepID=UPI00159EB795|nr:hypothetical protein [Duganella sp. SG902]NVM77471.1 hypothetical protein [Duganella sp. SG902]